MGDDASMQVYASNFQSSAEFRANLTTYATSPIALVDYTACPTGYYENLPCSLSPPKSVEWQHNSENRRKIDRELECMIWKYFGWEPVKIAFLFLFRFICKDDLQRQFGRPPKT